MRSGKTTKSGNMLKSGIRREELGFASDTLSSDPNACPLISTFSRSHSEVASTTHLPARRENVLHQTNGFRESIQYIGPANPDYAVLMLPLCMLYYVQLDIYQRSVYETGGE